MSDEPNLPQSDKVKPNLPPDHFSGMSEPKSSVISFVRGSRTASVSQIDDAVLQQVAPGCVESPEVMFRKSLEARGLKYTSERREILKAVLSTHEHFDADWLFVEMKKLGAKASKATVYRSLVLLCDTGILREVFQGPHGAYFEHVYGHEHHEHMICLKCGKVLEFISRKLEELQDDACRAMDFQPVRHHLQVFGYCSECHAGPIGAVDTAGG